MQKIITLISGLIVILILIVGAYWIFSTRDSDVPDIGFSYTNTSSDEIQVDLTKGAFISSPLTLTGQARGSWLFEATAPVVIVNWDGLIIGQGYIESQSDWMTEDFVPFTGTIEFEKPEFGDGAVILQAANASGLPEFDKAIEIPIRF